MLRLVAALLVLLAVNPARADQPPPPAPVVVAVPVAVPVEVVVPAPAPEPLAGYNGSFFLRDPKDWFVLYPKGRLQVDGYTYPSPGNPPTGVADNGAKDTRPKNTIFVRRARIELVGTFFSHFDFSIAGEFGSVPSTGQYGTITDAYVIVNYLSWLQLQVGQFDGPFSMENRTSDKYFDFMERSLAVRDFGVPGNKDNGAMLFGFVPLHLGYYSFGIFDGDGQSFKAQDGAHPAFIGRAVLSPLGSIADGRKWLENIWVGGSIWTQDNVNLGGTSGVAGSTTGATQNDLTAMTTQGAFGFFSSNYANGKDALGNAIRSHLAPNGQTLKWALEANIPFWRMGLRGEFIHVNQKLSLYNDTNPANATITRATLAVNSDGSGAGVLNGQGYYIELWGWLLGDPFMIEAPGFEAMPHYKPGYVLSDPRWGLMLALKYEHVNFNVSGITAAGAATADPGEGGYAIDTIEVGLNAWGTKHVRLTANYVANFIGGFGAKSATDPTNSEATNMKSNLYYGKVEHELLFRAGINL